MQSFEGPMLFPAGNQKDPENAVPRLRLLQCILQSRKTTLRPTSDDLTVLLSNRGEEGSQQ